VSKQWQKERRPKERKERPQGKEGSSR